MYELRNVFADTRKAVLDILHNILKKYGLPPPLEIKPIYNNTAVWQINDKYILKKSSEEEKDIEKTLMITGFLKNQNIPVIEYVKTVNGDYYVSDNGDIYSLIKKINGEHINPSIVFADGCKKTARHIGEETARLHKALKKIGNDAVYESDFINELKNQILEIKSKNIEIPHDILEFCLELDEVYHLLPKQVIHRDMHSGNMLFYGGKLTAFLDFDSSQVNARLFDIAYFGQSMLFIGDNYKNENFVKRWKEFFDSFLRGYNSVNELNETETKSLHRLCASIQIGFISFYLWLETKRNLVPNRLDMLKWMYYSGIYNL